ncbi:sensor histidine kinase [Streptomyces sp. HSG2]|uniref:sensor histidine kinase n=1 Tax=Streptomyces sp. HSG2 TaxID=2797167 RepID=UPI001906C114|nr:sensor histidine kinase [Streptomyces sp. HSG2]
MRRSKKGPEPSARGNFTPPSRAATAAPGPDDASEDRPAPPRGRRLGPRNWRVATRLNAILLIPALVALVMGGFQVKGSVDTWRDAEAAEHTARLVRAALTYADALYIERDVSAAPLLRGDTDDPAVGEARAATDRAAEVFDREVLDMPDQPGLRRRLQLLREQEPKLESLRAAAYTSELKGVETQEGYLRIAHPLTEFANELGLGTGNVTSYGRTVYAMSLTKSALSLQRSIGTQLLVEPGPDPGHLAAQRVALSSYAYLERVAIEEYVGGGTEEDARRLEEAQAKLAEDSVSLVQEAEAADPDYVPPPTNPATMVTEVALLESTDEAERVALAAQGITPENWWAVTTLRFDAYRALEADLADRAVSEASGIADAAERDTYITGAVVVVALLAAFVLAGMVARQMSRSMRRLRNAAFGVAEERLPLLVDQLSRTDPGRVDTRVPPIAVESTDEIGEVARAFDRVHREAVRLAAEQAMLRGNINAIFTNLSRRNQSLIEGQLNLITELENSEADPDQLQSLFKLDHLATRMRRNGENLLVLAGQEPGRRWDQPVPLVDVLRAASSEVEQYERIELSGVPEADIHGRAVTDLVHLLAELLENATTFSSPQTKVRVTATRLPDDRLMIEIHDKGIGLTAEDFADINHRLANPPTVDATISQRMGLFVVGRLAERHDIRVQLRPSGEQAGTTSLVMLPDAITHGGGGEGADGDEFTVSQMIPEQVAGGEDFGRPTRTAAELGFDDSRYAPAPGDADASAPRVGPPPRQAPPDVTAVPVAGDAGPTPPGGGFTSPPFLDERPGRTDDQYAASAGREDPAGHGGARRPDHPEQPFGERTYPRDPYGERSYDAGTHGHPPHLAERDGQGSWGHAPDATTPTAGPAPTPAGPRPTLDAPGHPPSGRHPDDLVGFPDHGSGAAGAYATGAGGAESTRAADGSATNGVGFGSPLPEESAGHTLTDAGLPRRGSPANGAGDARRVDTVPPAPAATTGHGSRAGNDERWQQASALRKPKAGGVTSSGLPRRVPRANLVEGAAETTSQGGPQVSRAPEDVRGRLSNLRRGVQRGRTAGSETNGQGLGPDSTYDQER